MLRKFATLMIGLPLLWAQLSEQPSTRAKLASPNYVLNSGDEIIVRVLDVSEIPPNPIRIDDSGDIRISLAGKVKASGHTVEELETILTDRLKEYILSPEVSVSITAYRSQPVTVMGSVKNPGVYQLEGRKTLAEVLSMAGGPDPSSGETVKITRRLTQGTLPLPNAATDPTGEFSIAEAHLYGSGNDTIGTLILHPFDSINVPKAQMIYVLGQVNRAGAFPLQEKRKLGILEAVALAGGLDSTASPQNGRLLRYSPETGSREEVHVDLRSMLEGKSMEAELMPEDILFVPSSVPKKAALRAVEAAVQMGTGVVIWRH